MNKWIASKCLAAKGGSMRALMWAWRRLIASAGVVGVALGVALLVVFVMIAVWPYQGMGIPDRVSLIGTMVVAWATVVLCAITAEYVNYTKLMLREMQAAREPFVAVEFRQGSQYGRCRLSLQNVTDSPAQNVRVEVLRDTDWYDRFGRPDDFSTDSLPLVKNGISYLAPQGAQSVDLMWPFPTQKPEDYAGKSLRLRVTWQDLRSGRFGDVIDYDFSDFVKG